MIKILLGNIGSGKTACTVRELMLNKSNRITFSNIKTKGIKNNVLISSDMIIKKEIIKTKQSGQVIYKLRLNVDFWKKVIKKYKSINVIIDEAHTILNARRAMSDVNKIMTDFMSLLRRIIGSSESGYGELVLISQLERRIDIVAKEMSTNVRYHLCHYKKTCKICFSTWNETNEIPEPLFNCPKCGSWQLIKHSHVIEVWHFKNVDFFVLWKYYRKKTYHQHYLINDIENYFHAYNTLQWENLISD